MLARTPRACSPFLFSVLAFAMTSPALAAQTADLGSHDAASGARLDPAPEHVSAVRDEITGERLVALRGNTHPLARPINDLGAVLPSVSQAHILLLLKRTDAQQQALDQLMRDQQTPGSASFHQWITPDAFGSTYGPSAGDIRRVTVWLQEHGFVINRVAAGRTFIDFSGDVGTVNRTFHTAIHQYRAHGEVHFANASDPLIPASLAPLVAGFRSLNDFYPRPLLHRSGRIARLSRKTHRWTTEGVARPSLTETGTPSTWLVTPQDFNQIYGVNQVWPQTVSTAGGSTQNLVGTGQTIAVIGDTDLAPADIQAFRDQFGLSAQGPNGSVLVEHPPTAACSQPKADQTNYNNNDPEGYLDAEWAGAAAPDATIDFVPCASSGVSAGSDLAASWIVNDAAHAQTVSVLSSSYGDCEGSPNAPAAQFYVDLWQQAAAEGMTVVVAAGDNGGYACGITNADPGYDARGLSVNAEASTPYNIAVGGTDFSDVYSGSTANYWNTANNSTFQSAKSYIPEMTWNDSCASPLVLQHFGQGFTASAGQGGFCTYASQQPIPPTQADPQYFNPFSGGGGPSVVSPKPAWQAGVTGIPQDGERDIPDISLFASSGFTWSHALVYCDSAYNENPGQVCDFTSSADVFANEDGGTSFAAPAFAGIMALIAQKSGSRQGQANAVLYPLAAQQYVSGSNPAVPSLTTCAASLGTGVLSSCIFRDINVVTNADSATSAQTPYLSENTSIPCTGSASAAGTYTDQSTDAASNPANCYGYQIQVADNNGTLQTAPVYYGVLSTADTAGSPAYSATPGYDLATGLGTPNVLNLVNAPQWTTGGSSATMTVEPLGPTTIAAGGTIKLTATILGTATGEPVQAGRVAFYSGAQPLGSANLACGGNGAVSLAVTGKQLGGAGTYGDIHAVYEGATQSCGTNKTSYYGLTSAPVTVVVARSNAARQRPSLPRSGRELAPPPR